MKESIVFSLSLLEAENTGSFLFSFHRQMINHTISVQMRLCIVALIIMTSILPSDEYRFLPRGRNEMKLKFYGGPASAHPRPSGELLKRHKDSLLMMDIGSKLRKIVSYLNTLVQDEASEFKRETERNFQNLRLLGKIARRFY